MSRGITIKGENFAPWKLEAGISDFKIFLATESLSGTEFLLRSFPFVSRYLAKLEIVLGNFMTARNKLEISQ